jgi:uncharacterized protein (DUF736 family)
VAIIGTFTASADGGWTGSIRTLSISAKVRFVPNDNRENDKAPAFKLVIGHSEIGAAWIARGRDEASRPYLRVQMDDPFLGCPVSAALFELEGGERANLVWSRRIAE